jgi:hypothetical protein
LRRKFVDAVKSNRQDVAATRIVSRMDELLAIDSDARAEDTDHAARHRLRRQKVPPWELTIERTRAGLEVARQLGRKRGPQSDYPPSFAVVSEGKTSEIKVARTLRFAPEAQRVSVSARDRPLH